MREDKSKKHVYFNIKTDIETRDRLLRYSKSQMRTLPVTGGLIVKHFLDAHQEKKEEQASLNAN